MFSDFLSLLQPYLLFGWLIGVVIFSLRLTFGVLGMFWLKHNRKTMPVEFVAILDRLSARMELVAPEAFLSSRTRQAIVVGFLKPVILMPAAWLMDTPPNVLEAILAHELAHIRRFDVWVNVLQRIVETLLFYHPAVWWLSRRLRLEREMCCDQLAVAATGNRLVYATALETVARGKCHRQQTLWEPPSEKTK